MVPPAPEVGLLVRKESDVTPTWRGGAPLWDLEYGPTAVSSTTEMEGNCATRGTGRRTGVPTHAHTAGATGVSGAEATIVHRLTNALRPGVRRTGDRHLVAGEGKGQRRAQKMTQRRWAWWILLTRAA